VATLRTIRELTRHRYPLRAWDLSLQTGVSPQGSANTLSRLREFGLVEAFEGEPGQARWFCLDSEHYLAEPLGWLFAAEWSACQDAIRAERRARLKRRGLVPRGGSSTPA
jgi:hypothetical protein